jgi:hypothetical protein
MNGINEGMRSKELHCIVCITLVLSSFFDSKEASRARATEGVVHTRCIFIVVDE